MNKVFLVLAIASIGLAVYLYMKSKPKAVISPVAPIVPVVNEDYVTVTNPDGTQSSVMPDSSLTK